MKKRLQIPRWKDEEQERTFWSRVDLAEYFGAGDLHAVSFPNLKPTSRAISLRLPEAMLLRLKEHARGMQVPYQSLIKQYIARGLSDRQRRQAA